MPAALRVLLLGTPLIQAGEQAPVSAAAASSLRGNGAAQDLIFQAELSPPFAPPLQSPVLLSLSRRALRLLLYYLACQREPLTRGQLAAFFWEEQPEATARKNLRETLSRLRSELPDPELLQADTERVWLDPQRVSSDVREFDALYEQASRLCARIPLGSPLPEGVRETIRRALGLWRGPQFLPGIDVKDTPVMDEWLAYCSQRLYTQRLHLLDRLAEHESIAGSQDAAIRLLREALAVEPANDQLNQRLLLLLEKNGRTAEGVQHLAHLREIYQREGFSGLPQTLSTLGERLRAHSVTDQAGGTVSGPVVRRVLQLPLVGRSAEMDALRQAFQRHACVILVGESGSGKSRILADFLGAVGEETRVLALTSRGGNGGIPFDPLVTMLRETVSAEDWRALPKTWSMPIALLMPELNSIIPGAVGPNSNSALSQSIVFEALHQVLQRLAEQRPLILALDDAQWCDEATFLALAYLLEKGFFSQRAFLIVSARLENQQPACAEFLARCLAHHEAVQIRLNPLTRADITEILRMIYGQWESEDLAGRLLLDTGGNPLFLVETLRGILEYAPDSLAMISSGNIPLAGSVHALIRERLLKLSGEAQNLLSLAAVAGSDFSFELLERAGRLEAEQVVRLVEELEHAQLLRPATQPEASVATRLRSSRAPQAGTFQGPAYAFAHNRVREIILMEMSPARRRLFHLRVAETLVEKSAVVPAALKAVLAEHYQQAGEDRLAFQNWLEAGEHACRLYAMTEAHSAFQQAENLFLRIENDISDEWILRLYANLIEVGVTQADQDLLQRSAQSLLRFGWRRGCQPMLRAAYLGQCSLADLRSDAVEGMNLLALLRPFLEGVEDLRAWTLYRYHRSGFLLSSGRLTEAVAELESALELLSQSGETNATTDLAALCGYRLSTCYLLNGWPHRAVDAAETALANSRTAMNHNIATLAVTALSKALFMSGQNRAAYDQSQIALRMASTMQNRPLVNLIHVYRSEHALALGYVDEAWQELRLAEAGGDESLFPQTFSRLCRQRGDILRLFGDAEEACALFSRAVALASGTYVELEALYRLGQLQVHLGQAEEGMRSIEHCIEACRLQNAFLYLIHALAARVNAYILSGQLVAAHSLAEEVAVLGAQHGFSIMRIFTFSALATLALSSGDMGEARQKGLAVAQYGLSVANPFLEIHGLSLTLQADPAQPAARERLAALLAHLDRHVQDPEIRPSFERYRARVQVLISA